MRDHSNHIQVNKDTAIQLIMDHCRFQPEAEEIRVCDAAGRILAEDVYAQWDSPNALTCRMDSVAVHWVDFEGGMPDTSGWERGRQWEFANTGVAMPEGFDTAIVVEHVVFSEDDSKIRFTALPSGKYAGTSAPGSKMKKGDLLVKKGTKITALLAAYITSGNNTTVKVLKKPRVSFLPTGNELVSIGGKENSDSRQVAAGGDIPTGKNIESNSLMIAEKIRSWGGEPVVFDIVPDEKEALKAALKKAAEETDIVVLNAGSSKGNDDWGIEMLEEIGTVLYHQTNHGPGHHSSFGLIDDVPVVGISGPPGGAAFTTDYYLYPAMMMFLGQKPRLPKVKARLAADIPSFDKHKKMEKPEEKKGEARPLEGGEFYGIKQMKLRLADDGMLEAYPLSGTHPGPAEAETADAYYAMPSWAGKKSPEKGDLIEVELRPEYVK